MCKYFPHMYQQETDYDATNLRVPTTCLFMYVFSLPMYNVTVYYIM